MAVGETPGPLGTRLDRYFEDITADELPANAPADETSDDKNARRGCNMKRNKRRRRLRESLPIQNLTEALDQVESQVHTTPEQCLMSITTIARQGQGMRVGELIAKLMEDAYFMRVHNRVTQVPPLRTREADHEATSRSPADNGRNRTQGELPQNPNLTRASTGGPSQGGNSVDGAGGSRAVAAHGDAAGEAAAAGAPPIGLEGEPVAEVIAEAEATQIAPSLVSHAAATMPAAESKKFDATSRPRQAKMTASPSSLLDFAICFSHTNSSLWESPSMMRSKIQCSGSDATPSPSKTLVATTTRGASTSLCLDQAPLTWLESLEKYSIDKWNQLKEQFTNNFAGAMGRSGTRMDLAMVK
jgi:hypothetical protein